MGEAHQTGQKRQWWTMLLMATGAFLVTLVVALVVAVVFACWFLGIHSREDLLVYRCLTREGSHPIWKDLALRRVRLGDNLAEATRLHPPRRRDDFGPYTVLLYREDGSLDTLWIFAENEALISAYVRSSCGTHVFFESRAHVPAFRSAWVRHRAQINLETEAWHIHRAISAGQDVFTSDRIQRRELPRDAESGDDQDYIRQLTQITVCSGEKVCDRDAKDREPLARVHQGPRREIGRACTAFPDISRRAAEAQSFKCSPPTHPAQPRTLDEFPPGGPWSYFS